MGQPKLQVLSGSPIRSNKDMARAYIVFVHALRGLVAVSNRGPLVIEQCHNCDKHITCHLVCHVNALLNMSGVCGLEKKGVIYPKLYVC